MKRDINAKGMAALSAGRDLMADPDYVKAVEDYREWCKANGLS